MSLITIRDFYTFLGLLFYCTDLLVPVPVLQLSFFKKMIIMVIRTVYK